MKNMSLTIAITAALAITLSACSEKPAEPAPAPQTPPAATAAPPVETTTPPAKTTEPPAASTETTTTFRCDSGAVVTVVQHSLDRLAVTYQDKTQEMQIAISASGSRYVGKDLVWWSKGSGPGSEATLFRLTEQGETGDIVESCVQQ